jgi:nitrilase
MNNGLVRVAIVQHAPVFLNLDKSVELACELIEEAARAGARVIAFGETWLPGYPVWIDSAPNAALWGNPAAQQVYRTLVESSISLPGPHVDRLLAAAATASAWVVMGAHERRGGTLYNSLLYLDPAGACVTVHRKLVPTYTERLMWGRGDGSTLSVVDTDFGVLGGLICWEHWMPLARAAMHARHEVVHVAQWPSVRELHQIASRHYAFEGQCFVLAAGCMLSRGQVLEGFRSLGLDRNDAAVLLASIPGSADTLLMNGGSTVIAPDTSVLSAPLFDQEAIVTADVDLGQVAAGHLVMDTNGHYARPDVFRLEVDDRPQESVRFGPR